MSVGGPLRSGRGAIALLGLLGLLALACGGLGRLGYERRLDDSEPAASHALHDARLVEVMRSLERLQAGRLPKAMNVDAEIDARRQEIAAVARAMAESARDITPPSWLAAERREEFSEYAERLRRAAVALAGAAPELPPAGLREQLGVLQANCHDCHGRFEVPMQRALEQERPPGDE